jgi:hypothetical protein
MTPFIQVTWESTEPPIRHTVSVEGADDVLLAALLAALLGALPVAAGALLELPELQPAIASAAAAALATAPSAAVLFLSPTAGTPSARVNSSGQTWCMTRCTETNWKLSYKIDLLPELNKGLLACGWP